MLVVSAVQQGLGKVEQDIPSERVILARKASPKTRQSFSYVWSSGFSIVRQSLGTSKWCDPHGMRLSMMFEMLFAVAMVCTDFN